jgi:multidrug efflux pump subunit AcrA (membrane-fusion protein)
MKTVNRAWVKNAAIIFLAALLALTFFSNTILNRSLPEVSGQNAYGGEISTAVRLTGAVTANETWAVNLDATRQIKKVLVRVGDMVEAGQAIFELEPADSTELKAAEKALENLRREYSKFLINLPSEGASKTDQRDVADLQEAISEATGKRTTLEQFSSQLEQAEKTAETATEKVKTITTEIEVLNDQIANIVVSIDPDLLTDEMKKYQDALTAAQDYKSFADSELTLAMQERSNAQSGISGVPDTSALQQQLAAANDLLNRSIVASATIIENKFKTIYENDKNSNSGANAGKTYPSAYDDYATKSDFAKSDALESMLDELAGVLASSGGNTNDMIKTLGNDITIVQSYAGAKAQIKNIEDQIAGSGTYNTDYLNRQVELAQQRVSDAATSLESAQKRYDDATKNITVTGKKERQELETKVKAKTLTQKSLQRAETDAKEELAKVQEKAGLTTGGAVLTLEQALRAADEAIKTAERALEDKLFAIEVAQDAADKQVSLNNIEVQRMLGEISDQQEEVTRLRGKETGSEVTTKYGGAIMSIGKVAGDNTSPGEPLAQIEINGKGFTLSKSVTNEEAQRVRIGDVANINAWGSSGITCTLTAIKTDRDNPTRNKLLEFDVEGDVTAGQQLELSIGTRTQYYENVVPNNAVREDSNGKFVLIAQAKQAPLGTRYIAVRADVEVINSDSKNTAISGTFDEWAPFIITQASKPVLENTQVRLAG